MPTERRRFTGFDSFVAKYMGDGVLINALVAAVGKLRPQSTAPGARRIATGLAVVRDIVGSGKA